jgi:restriction system protein
MAIPTFLEVMLPFVELTADGVEHQLQQTISDLADHFHLTDAERVQLLPSGFQATFTNRVAWASTHLRKAGLLERTGRGRFRITERGKAVLAERPTSITIAKLATFPEYQQFKSGAANKEPGGASVGGVSDDTVTPEEAIENMAASLRSSLAQELLERVKAAPPEFFERLVVDLLVAMGYGGSRADAGQAVGRTGDGGVDGIIKEDRLGLDVVYIQAKRWEKNVGGPEVREFAGSLDGHRATKGVVITTSGFTPDATSFVRAIGKRIVLIDGRQLADLMIDFGIGVSTVATYTLRRVDNDFFEPTLA